MKTITETLVLEDLGLNPKSIWQDVSDEMNRKYPTWNGTTDCQVKTLVKNTRTKVGGGDVFRTLEKPPMNMVKSSDQFFYSLICLLQTQILTKYNASLVSVILHCLVL